MPHVQSLPRYSKQKKNAYRSLCRQYNAAFENFAVDKAAFVRLSIQLHKMKGDVPVKWRTLAFIRSCRVESVD